MTTAPREKKNQPMRTARDRYNFYLDELNRQLVWMEKCGRTLAGYIAQYGDRGAAIFDADDNRRAQLETKVLDYETKQLRRA